MYKSYTWEMQKVIVITGYNLSVPGFFIIIGEIIKVETKKGSALIGIL